MAEEQLVWYEFFAGGGMARLGLGERWRCAFANEWSAKKAAAYRAYFGAAPELRICDVHSLTPADLPGRADLAWASFPCQDLSLAGRGIGLNGARSGTFKPFWRLMEGLAAEGRPPRAIVLENVPGALTSDAGRDFIRLFECFARCGYRAGAMVIDAVRFVPQSRPRLFLVAGRDPVRPSLASREALDAWHPRPLRLAFERLPRVLRAHWIWWQLPEPPPRVPSLESVLDEMPEGVRWHEAGETRHLLSLMSEVHAAKLRDARRRRRFTAGALYRRTRRQPDGSKRQRAEVRFDGVSGCLRTPAGGSSRQTILLVEGERVRTRLLAPREAARLMGVPEDFPVPANYNDAYHLFGDGVVAPVVAWLNEHLLIPLLGRRS
jgi:DNA (cytosine-5)-methyltransferase 1